MEEFAFFTGVLAIFGIALGVFLFFVFVRFLILVPRELENIRIILQKYLDK
ncbi:MAG: hypothetical protein IJC33_03825 [Clostridia bacterium]|nr:hypothetical protein [Clostridia bacterium]